MSKIMSWADRFALIDHYKPSDEAICSAFRLSMDELDTARQLRKQGTFTANAHLDVGKYAAIFNNSTNAVATPGSIPTPTVTVPNPTATVRPIVPDIPTKTGTATMHGLPESASRKPKVPQKRGRKGDKISKALQAVPTAPMSVDAFIKEHGVSLAVLRQSKRFIEKMDTTVASQIGTVHVRQDKTTKQLMIWRETPTA